MKNAVKLFVLVIFGMCMFFASTTIPSMAGQFAESHFITSVGASHILVDSKEEAEFIKSKIDNGANFEAMAKRYSKCPSGANGGDLGYFERGQMVKPFEYAAFSLPAGQVSEPVQTQFGWHLIKVYDKK